MELAKARLFQAKWSATIHEEWIRNVLRNRPDLTLKQLEYTKQQMELTLPDATVTGYKAFIPSLLLPDPDDRHILAVALRSQASVILTFNLKDFPASALAPYRVTAHHPDRFIMRLVHTYETEVAEALERQRQRLRKPAKTQQQFIEILEKQGLKKVAGWLRAKN